MSNATDMDTDMITNPNRPETRPGLHMFRAVRQKRGSWKPKNIKRKTWFVVVCNHVQGGLFSLTGDQTWPWDISPHAAKPFALKRDAVAEAMRLLLIS